MKTYAYIRVSTKRQSLQRQINNITAAFPEISPKDYFQDKFTGTTQDRPAWNELLKNIQPGDTIVFDSVSRMSRDAEEGLKQYMELYEMGINLVFLNEPYISTSIYRKSTEQSIQMTGNKVDIILSAINEYLREVAKDQIQIAFEQAEKENTDRRQRAMDGMKASGNMGGRKQGFRYTSDKVKAARKRIEADAKEFGGTMSDKDLMKVTEISRDTLYRLKREIRAERVAAE